MQYDFLKNFPDRMRTVGLYALLLQNSMQKGTWKQYKVQSVEEQLNLLFAVLLFIMEQSLKEEPCTMDDIGAYIDQVNTAHFHKELSYEDCRNLGDFMINVVLSNEGKVMHFEGYNFDTDQPEEIPVRYLANRIVYLDRDLRRTSYYLTDDGYNLLLGTLEMENNMKLTIHEMIFQMHLEKQSYDKAVDEIKNVFNLMRIQLQKIQEAMDRIRRNALSYSVQDYQEILTENLNTIGSTKEKFVQFREMVRRRVQELEEEDINIRKLSPEEAQKLSNLREIEGYLNRTIDEHQKILTRHFDLKDLYTRELESLTEMSLIRRFSLRSEVYDKVMEQPSAMEDLLYFLRPLFRQEPEKIYNLNKAFGEQSITLTNVEEDSFEEELFDEEAWRKEQERRFEEQMARYRGCLKVILTHLMDSKYICDSQTSENGTIRKNTDCLVTRMTLADLEADLTAEEKVKLIPTSDIFKEVMVELLRNRVIRLETLRKEQSEVIKEHSMEFQLNDMLLHMTQEDLSLSGLIRLEAARKEDGTKVVFSQLETATGVRKNIRCSNVTFTMERRNEPGHNE